ncbi:hypothetical protein [uncultured Dubosiella sp.]|uniref:hypothetical protein n=3 Tax=uncultured Dubosiella sp. TaxID=1937011 RepID=UPI0025B1E6FA|nr:hypothetical protein [uncultured Dubosiella sp.]
MIYVNFMGKYVNRSKWLFLWGDRPKKRIFFALFDRKNKKKPILSTESSKNTGKMTSKIGRPISRALCYNNFQMEAHKL